MNNLFRHIEYLLLRHDCVIVPGLGAFIATFVPARVDRETCRITPPCRSIMFNQAVTLDDGLLANSYARTLSLSFEEARQIISKDVATLFDALRRQELVKVGRLGSLSLGVENQLTFTHEVSPESIYSKMGLSAVTFPAPAENTVKKSVPVALSSIGENSEKRGLRRNIIRFSAVFAVLLAVAIAVILYPMPHDEREQRASVVPVEVIVPAIKQQAKEITPIPETNPAPINPVSEPVVAEEIPQSLPTHYLIVATFHSQKEADKFVEIYSTPEISLKTVSSRKVTRVYSEASDDKQEMIKKLNTPEVTQRFPHAWIWSSND